MRNFIAAIAVHPLVFDGAMGTMIHAKGVFLNVCYDELCLTRPDLIMGIHAAYVAAGAEVIETNSFSANGIRLARQAAGEDLLVAGSVGPCLRSGQLWRPAEARTLRDAFAEQIAALVENGVDVICAETFTHIEELLLAAGAARRGTARAGVLHRQ